MADAYADRLKGSYDSLKNDKKELVQVADDHKFVGFDAYKNEQSPGGATVAQAHPHRLLLYGNLQGASVEGWDFGTVAPPGLCSSLHASRPRADALGS